MRHCKIAFYLVQFIVSTVCLGQNILPQCDVECSPKSNSTGYGNVVQSRPASVNVRARSRVFSSFKGPAKTSIQTGNQSFNYSIPILHLPGRNGLDLNLNLYYNSQVWSLDQSDLYFTFNADRDWPSYGFRLDFGYMESSFDVNGAPQYVLTEADGSKHLLVDILDSTSHITNNFASNDSSYFIFNGSTLVLTAKNGTQSFYQGFPSQGSAFSLYRPTRIEDSNGNYISIQYVSGKDQAISVVTDTLGRVVNFTYDASGRLQSVYENVAAGATKTFATFAWGQAYTSGQVWYNFTVGAGGAPAAGTALNVLTGCSYPNGTGYSFAYGDWGIVNRINTLASGGATRSYVRYDFPAASAGPLSSAPTFQHQFVSSDGNSASELQWTYAVTEDSSRNVTGMSVTDPSGTTRSSALSQGLLTNETIQSGSTTLRTTVNSWVLDGAVPHNNQLQQVTVTLNDASPTQQSHVTYGYDVNGNVTDLKEYNYDGSLLRETASSFATIGNHIVDRPTQVIVKDGSGNIVSRTDYAYDQYSGQSSLADGGSNVAAGHDQAYSSAFGARGNLTSVTRYANAAGGTGAISRSFSYDTTGNVVSAQVDCCTQKQWTYSSNYQYAYPESTTVGPSAGPKVTTSATYDFYAGLLLTSTDENNQLTHYAYNDPNNRLTQIIRPNGAQINTTYTDSASPIISTANTANSLVQNTTYDGLGRIVQSAQLNGASVLSVVDTTYDSANRIVKTDNAHAPGEAQLYTSAQTDALGRTVLVTPPSGGALTSSYNGNSVTVTDPAGKQRRSFSDAAGRLVQVDEPGATFSGSSGSGPITIGGTLQSKVVGTAPATSGTGSVSIIGGEKQMLDPNGPGCTVRPPRCFYIYDAGTLSVSVNGYSKSATYGQTSTGNSVAIQLAGLFHNDGSSPVDAVPSGSSVLFTTRATGASTNYSISASSQTNDPSDFGSPSFSPSPSGSTLTGGMNANPGTTVYDTGNISLTVTGFQATASYSASVNSNSSLLAGALASALNGSGSPVHASASGNVISVVTNSVGLSTNYAITSSSNTTSPNFSSASFSSGGATLAGGADPYGNGIAHPYSTYYAYNVLDQLQGVTQGNQTRTYNYDSLGRLTSAVQPESGTTAYGYLTSGGGNCSPDPLSICSRTDARNVTTTYAYDALDRVSNVSYNDGITPSIGYTYDQGGTGAFAMGRLTSMSDGLGSESYQYDLMGRTTHVNKIVSGVAYNLSYGYNADSTVSSITYPSGRIVNPSYDAIGRLLQIGSSGTNFLSNLGYNGANLASGLNYGNGVQAQFGYNDHLQIQTLKYTQGANDLLDLSYSYGTLNNGQIQSVTDNANSARSTQYTYDPWSRLSAAQTTNVSAANTWMLNWSYDRYGNRLNQNLAGGVGASVTQPQLSVDPASNRINTGGYAYDAAGNMTADSINTYGYDGENRIVSLNGAASASYDGNGLRVKKGSTVYIYSGSQPVAEYNGASLISEYIYGPNGLLATIPAGGSPTYSVGDHLSARLQMDASANITRSYGHFPFGETWYETTANKWKFTSYERDADSNLDYAINRAYSSRLGRFMQADPYARSMNGRNPQSLNRYGYVLNNPVGAVDLLGLDCMYIDERAGIVSLLQGDCLSDSDNGIFIDGKIDVTSINYNPGRNSLGFSYTADSGLFGGGTVQLTTSPEDVSDDWATSHLDYLDYSGWMGSPLGLGDPIELFKQHTLKCYNDTHRTKVGKAIELGSILALTPADDEYKTNLGETFGLGSLKAFGVWGANKWGAGLVKTIGTAIEDMAGRLAPSAVGAATAADVGALAACGGSTLNQTASGFVP